MAEGRQGRRQREALVSERDFLLGSLEDLELEHAAGDLDEADYAALRAGYVERSATTLRALEALDAPSSRAAAQQEPNELGTFRRLRRTLGRRRARRVMLAVTAMCAVGVLSIVALSLAGVRLPGQSATGSVNIPANETISQDLSEASLLGSSGELTEAISLYDAVLQRAPDNAQALTYRSWLVRLVGIAAQAADSVRTGDAGLASAVKVAPGYAPARAFLGLAELQDDHDASAAVVQFRAFFSDKPSATLLSSVGPEVAQAYLQAHLAVPSAFRRYLGANASASKGS